MRVKYVLVDTLVIRVFPKDCIIETHVPSSTTTAVKDAFPGCAISVWDGEAWNPVDGSTEALMVEGASLKVVQPPPASKAQCYISATPSDAASTGILVFSRLHCDSSRCSL